MDHGPLLVRRHATEDRGPFQDVGELLLILGEGSGIDPRVGVVDPGPSGDCGDCCGVVAGDHLENDTLFAEELEDLRCVGPNRVLEVNERNGVSLCR